MNGNGARVLVVEDDAGVADMLRRGLAAEGYAVEVAANGMDGLEMARRGTHAVLILDLLLPGLDGRAVCQALREGGSTMPVLMLTALDALEDKVEGLQIGADDYLAKPFAFDELLARLAALIRRSRITAAADSGRVVRVADITFDRDTLIVSRAGRRLDLTRKELALLELLISAPGRVFSRERILKEVWGLEEDPLTNVVDVYVSRLRRKLEAEGGPPVLLTVRGHGYRLDTRAGEDPPPGLDPATTPPGRGAPPPPGSRWPPAGSRR